MQENVLKLWCNTLKGGTMQGLHVFHFHHRDNGQCLAMFFVVYWLFLGTSFPKHLSFVDWRSHQTNIVHWLLSWWWNETQVASARSPLLTCCIAIVLWLHNGDGILYVIKQWNYFILMRYRKEMQFHLLPEMYNKMSNQRNVEGNLPCRPS